MKRTLILISIILFTQTIYAQVEELTFTSDNWELNASLYLPAGDGPFKAAVLVHGSGPIDRYQTIPITDGNSQCIYPQLFGDTIQNFKNIALHLQANDIAVFTYDKRTLTYINQLNPITVSTKDFVTDAQNAVSYLASRSEIDQDQIFLIGHSQGAALIPVAAQNINVAGLISLAGAATPPDTLVARQFRDLYIQCSNDTASGDAIANSFFNEFNKIRNNQLEDDQQIFINFPDNPNPIPYGFPIFWRDWFDMADNVIENYKNAGLPTLIIHGTDDWNVSIEDAYKFQNALPEELTSVQIFDGLNHFLTPIDEPVVASAILQAISAFIQTPVIMPNVALPEIFETVNVTYNNDQILINTTVDLDAIFISSIDGKLLKNIPATNAGLFNIEAPINYKIVLLSLIKDEAILTKKLMLY